MAQAATPAPAAKIKRTVPRGRMYVSATFNNTLVSITDEKGNTFFLVKVRTNKSSLGANLPIIPGMVAEVDIITGQKSILSYLLKPVLRAKQGALTER